MEEPSRELAMEPHVAIPPTDGIPPVGPDINLSDNEGDAPFAIRRALCAVWNRGRLGIAHYDEAFGAMYYGELAEEEDFSCLQLVKFQTAPTEIIVSSNQTEIFYKSVRKSIDLETPDNEYDIRVSKSSDFDFDASRMKIQQLNIADMPTHLSEVERTQHINAHFDYDQKQMIRAVGALISHLLRTSSDTGISVTSANVFSLSGLLTIDANASKSLQIFTSEQHPSVQGLGRAKEGLSLFSIFHERAKSGVGRQLLRFWFMRPILHIETLNDRLNTTEFFLDAKNMDMLKYLSLAVAHVKNVPKILLRVRAARATVHDFKHLAMSTAAMMQIREILGDSDLTIQAKISHYINDGVDEISNLLTNVIDFDASKASNRCVVKAFVDGQLDQFKQVYENLEEYLTSVAADEMSELPPDCGVTALRYVYFPQIGYLVVLSKAQAFESAARQLDFDFQFETNGYAYYKSTRARDLDEYFGDVYALIVDRENRIVREVESVLLEKSDVLINSTQVCAELDCLLAFANVAKDRNFSKPELVDEAVLEIVDGRHPLQELCVDMFIPNDTNITNESHMQIVTGPNYSGKSVYAKQVALITYLAHLGSFVPAKSAKIGLTDRIFTRETASVSQSSFMIDLAQVSAAQRHCSGRSLIIIDEFGKGTSPQEGMALLVATLKQLNSMKETPRVICTTHFHEIVELIPNVNLATMRVVVGEGDDSGNVVFLYKVVAGICTDSLGAYCARVAGVPDTIVNRGIAVSGMLAKGLPVGRIDQEIAEISIKRRAELVRLFVKLDIDDSTQVSKFLEFARN